MDYIPLGNNRGVAIVDDDDYEALCKYQWHILSGYAQTWIGGKKVRMHRMIMKAPPDAIIDHINRHKLDNRKSNLRFTNRRQNALNSPKSDNARGYTKSGNRWVAQGCKDMKNYYLGCYSNEEQAAQAYQEWKTKNA